MNETKIQNQTLTPDNSALQRAEALAKHYTEVAPKAQMLLTLVELVRCAPATMDTTGYKAAIEDLAQTIEILRCIYDADDATPEASQYPECYLHVAETSSGQTWVEPVSMQDSLSLTHHILSWAIQQYGPGVKLADELSAFPRQYYAKIMTDHLPPENPHCWDSGGFDLDISGC